MIVLRSQRNRGYLVRREEACLGRLQLVSERKLRGLRLDNLMCFLLE